MAVLQLPFNSCCSETVGYCSLSPSLSACLSSYTNRVYKAQLLSLAPVWLSTRGEVQGNHKVWIAQRTTQFSSTRNKNGVETGG